MQSSARSLLRLIIATAIVIGLYFGARALIRADGARSGGLEKAGLAGARATPVLTAAVEKRDVPVWIEGLGSVVAWRQVTIRAEVDGRLDQVFFKEGQAVHRGDLLAQIDPRPFMVQLHQAMGALARDQAQLDAARRDLVRFQELRKTNLVAQQQVDDQLALAGQAEGAVQVDQAAIESAKLNLDFARITAPGDGVVGVRLVDPGNLIHAADPTGIVVLTQLDPAAVMIMLPEDDLGQVMAAQARGEVPVEAWSRDGSTRLGAGKLLVIDNQINQTTATLRLKAEMRNPDHALWPNQFVKARLLVDTRRGARVVPAAAVQRGPQGTFVWIVGAGNKAAARPVDVALITSEVAVLNRGVEPGETVVIEGQNQLREGAEVSRRPPSGDPKSGANGGLDIKSNKKASEISGGKTGGPDIETGKKASEIDDGKVGGIGPGSRGGSGASDGGAAGDPVKGRARGAGR